MSVCEEKKALRYEIKRRLRELDRAARKNADAGICFLVLSCEEYKNADCVFCFVGTDSEIDTSELLKAVLSDGKRLCVPLCTGNGIMQPREITSLEVLKKGAYGILEPPESEPLIDIMQISLAIIPCVSCSHGGKRLGHGGGYYDRFLDGFMGSTLMLCYEELVHEDIPLEAHDRIIQPVITQRGVYR